MAGECAEMSHDSGVNFRVHKIEYLALAGIYY